MFLKGKYIAPLLEYHYEDEVLFTAGSKFNLLSFEERKGRSDYLDKEFDYLVIHLEEVQSDNFSPRFQ